MSGHRVGTDRTEARAVAECPRAEGADDDHLIVEFECEGDDEAVQSALDTLHKAWEDCGHCGRELDYVVYTEPTEVLD
jgi:DNA-directed RNA polymerase alpha subunit